MFLLLQCRERSLTPAESEVQFKAYLQRKLVNDADAAATTEFSASPTSLSPSSSLSTPPNSPKVSKQKQEATSGDELKLKLITPCCVVRGPGWS